MDHSEEYMFELIQVLQEEVLQLHRIYEKNENDRKKETIKLNKKIEELTKYRYQKILQDKYGVGGMTIKDIGTTDITTNDAHIDIKPWRDYSDALGQLGIFNQCVHRENLHVYLYGVKPKSMQLSFVKDFFTKYNIVMFSFNEDDTIVQHNFI